MQAIHLVFYTHQRPSQQLPEVLSRLIQHRFCNSMDLRLIPSKRNERKRDISYMHLLNTFWAHKEEEVNIAKSLLFTSSKKLKLKILLCCMERCKLLARLQRECTSERANFSHFWDDGFIAGPVQLIDSVAGSARGQGAILRLSSSLLLKL